MCYITSQSHRQSEHRADTIWRRKRSNGRENVRKLYIHFSILTFHSGCGIVDKIQRNSKISNTVYHDYLLHDGKR